MGKSGVARQKDELGLFSLAESRGGVCVDLAVVFKNRGEFCFVTVESFDPGWGVFDREAFRIQLGRQLEGVQGAHSAIDQTPVEGAGLTPEAEGASIDGDDLLTLPGNQAIDVLEKLVLSKN